MTDAIESLGRIRIQAIVLLIVAFVAGGLAGAAVEHVRLAHRRPAFPMGPGPAFGALRGGVPGYYNRLGLSPDQRARISAILKRAQPRTDSLLNETLPQLRAITDSVRREIRAVLTPDQAARLDRERRRRGWQETGIRPVPPGGPPPPHP